jgi:hypothetical protein
VEVNDSERILQAVTRALEEAAELSGQAPDWNAIARVAVEAATPLIEARALRQAALALRSNIGAADIPEPGDRLERWADNAEELIQKEGK